jgi:competence ComEA-like helix-hairpin-helix protein
MMSRIGIAFLFVSVVCAADLPVGTGRDLLLRACTGCHKADSFSAYRHTKDEYQSIVNRMAAERGAQASAKELDEIAAYLFQNFPKVEDPAKVNVNKATAKELETGLGLTAKEAAAIVSYRDRHGDFHAIGDLYIIYGVDGKKLEALQDKITF